MESQQQFCGSQGCETQPVPSFFVGRPIVRDGGGPAAAAVASDSPAALNLVPTANSGVVTLTLDPTWLQDASRTYPISVDLPVVTASAEHDTGVFGSVSSCAPTVPAPEQALAGTVGACTYHSLAYFDVSQLDYLSRLPVQAATLDVYTPTSSDAAGVAVYPNTPGEMLPAPPAAQAPVVPPGPPVARPVVLNPVVRTAVPPLPAIQLGVPVTWNDAPAPLTGRALQQTASDGHWQRWDIAAQLRQWLQNRRTNTGVTLVGPATGSPIAFASPLGGATDDPATAPYLDISFAAPGSGTQAVASGRVSAPRASSHPSAACDFPGGSTCTYNDTASLPYGVNNGPSPDGPTLSQDQNGDGANFVRVSVPESGFTCSAR